MVKAVYPGTFDPVTNGHIDIIRRAANVVDSLVIVVSVNSGKNPVFSMEERMDIIREVVKDIPNVSVIKSEELTVSCAKELGASIIIRGLRAVTDYENEMQLAQTNRYLDENIETMFMATSKEYSFLSSTVVKELAYYGADISALVPEVVEQRIKEKITKI